MSGHIPKVAAALLFLTAAFFSWGFYLFVPVTPALPAWPGHLPMSGVLPLWVMLQGAVGLLFILDLLCGRRPRVPFDLVWPPVLAIGLSLLDWLPGWQALSFVLPASIGRILSFWAIIHFVRSRESVRNWLEVAVWGGAAVCALSLAASFTRLVIPTAPADSWLLLAFSPRYGWALSTLAPLAPLALYFSASAPTPARRWAARVSLLLMAVVLAGLFLPGWRDLWAMANQQPHNMVSHGPLTVVIAWLLARIAAKLIVSGRETHDPFHWALLGTVLLGAVFGVLQARLTALAFLPALAAAYAHPGSIEAPRLTRRTKLAVAAPFALLAAFNLGYVNPGNPSDPRNYPWGAPITVEPVSAEVIEHLEFWEGRYPNEVQTHYRLAHVELARKNPCRAAYEFAQSLEAPAGRTILPPPTEDQRRYFLDMLRDFCSALPDPEGTVAYERALVAADRLDEARGLLQARVSDAAGSIESPSLKRAACTLLGAPEDSPLFDGWTDAQFLELLRKTGATIEPAPAGVSEERLPVVCIARFAPHSADLLACAGDQQATAAAMVRARTTALPEEGPAPAWNLREQEASLQAVLTLPGLESPLAVVTLGGSITIKPAATEIDALPPTPDRPLIQVWTRSIM